MVLKMSIQNLQKKKEKKWCLITSESKSDYSHEDPIKLLTKSIESIFYAYILVTGNIAVTRTIAAKPNANPAVEKKKRKTTTYCSYASSI